MSIEPPELCNTSSATLTPTTLPTVTAVAAAAAIPPPTANSSHLNIVNIKKELPSDEIKEFAENTMNELLGWYGFDYIDRLDLSTKTTTLLQTASKINSIMSQPMEKKRSHGKSARSFIQLRENKYLNMGTDQCGPKKNSRKNMLNCNSHQSTGSDGGCGESGCAEGHDSTTSDHETQSCPEDGSKSPQSFSKITADDKMVFTGFDICCWCRRPILENAPEYLTTSDGPRYCSESCFTQSRRASFKKAKTCDWCKHVRHAISYVDFQDGASQLQFCSDKCLNQYKMQIFCKETQAHLDMNPHLCEQGMEAAASGNSSSLITPELWMRNCRSRSVSPASVISLSPGPSSNLCASSKNIQLRNSSSNCLINSNSNVAINTKTPISAPHKPLISVAPVSKLMSKSPSIIHNRHLTKQNRKKRPLRACTISNAASPSGGPESTYSVDIFRETSMIPDQADVVTNTLGVSSSKYLVSSKPCHSTLSRLAGSSAQDLQMNVPPLSPILEQQRPPLAHSHVVPHTAVVSKCGTIPPNLFEVLPSVSASEISAQVSPTISLTSQGRSVLPRLGENLFSNIQCATGFENAQSVMTNLSNTSGLSTLIGTTPPVTVMVPYPIIIPLPIPIPIPLPVLDFYKAHFSDTERKCLNQQQKEEREEKRGNACDEYIIDNKKNCPESNSQKSNEPLDFTKFKKLSKLQEDDDSANINKNIKEQNVKPDETIIEHCAMSRTSPIESGTLALNQDKSLMVNNISITDNEDVEREFNDTKQRLPKFKISRIQTKRNLVQAKESECSRPLRKRKRIIDCDFQKIILKDPNALEAICDIETPTVSVTEATLSNNSTAIPTKPGSEVRPLESLPCTACNSSTKSQNNNNSV